MISTLSPTIRETKRRYKRTEKGRLAAKKYQASAKGVAARRKCRRLKYPAVKTEVLSAYSGGTMRCLRCGYDNQDALDLDHIANDGAVERKENRSGGSMERYRKLIRQGFPPGLQVLCRNCNWLKEVQRRRASRDN